MAGLGSSTGQLNSAAFWSVAGVTASHDADDRVMYNSTTGALYYDADGNQSTAAVQIAQMTANTVLTYQDFFIIYRGNKPDKVMQCYGPQTNLKAAQWQVMQEYRRD